MSLLIQVERMTGVLHARELPRGVEYLPVCCRAGLRPNLEPSGRAWVVYPIDLVRCPESDARKCCALASLGVSIEPVFSMQDPAWLTYDIHGVENL